MTLDSYTVELRKWSDNAAVGTLVGGATERFYFEEKAFREARKTSRNMGQSFYTVVWKNGKVVKRYRCGREVR